MLVSTIVRGNLIAFETSFLDAEGVPISPASVTVKVDFIDGSGSRTDATLTMSEDTDGEWSAAWDSSEAAEGRVYWSVRAYDPPAADQGFFQLAANRANPDEGVTG